MQRTNFSRLPLEEMISSSTKKREVLPSSEHDQIESINKSIGILIDLVSEVKESMKVVDYKVDGTIQKVDKIEGIITSVNRGCPLSSGQFTVKSNLTPVSELTVEESVDDKFWRLSDLTHDLKLRFTDPRELEEIAITTGAEFLMMIRLVFNKFDW